MRKTTCAMEAHALTLRGGTITLSSEASGREFVYKVGPRPGGGCAVRLETNGAPEYIGAVDARHEFRLREASGLRSDSLAVVVFRYFWSAASRGRGQLPAQLSFTIEPWWPQAVVRRCA